MKRTALRTAGRLGVSLPRSLARELIESDSDWVVQSYAIRGRRDKSACLLVSDGTEFASDIAGLAVDAGFHVVTLTTSLESSELSHLQEDLLQPYSLVVVIRGEHFAQFGSEEFYSELRRFVAGGGALFATPWVSWEAKYHHEFAEVLPFHHMRDTYQEDVEVICRPTDETFARQLLAEPISYRGSVELLERKEGSTVLLERADSVPILGYRPFGSGICYYFNTCQHLCSGYMASPLRRNATLTRVLGKLLERIRILQLASQRCGGGPPRL